MDVNDRGKRQSAPRMLEYREGAKKLAYGTLYLCWVWGAFLIFIFLYRFFMIQDQNFSTTMNVLCVVLTFGRFREFSDLRLSKIV